jgi:hypothetical protein
LDTCWLLDSVTIAPPDRTAQDVRAPHPYADTLSTEVLMRGPLFLVVLLSCGVATASAQGRREVGAKVGLTSASMVFETPEDNPGYGHRIYVSGGGFATVPVSGPLAFQVEALYIPKGGENVDKDLSRTTTLILDYLEFPALARVTVARGSSHGVHLFGGPSAGFRLNAKYRLAEGTTLKSGETDDIGDQVRRFEYGLIAGGGVEIGRHAVADARYSWGLSDVNRDAGATHGARTRAFTVLVGFRY